MTLIVKLLPATALLSAAVGIARAEVSIDSSAPEQPLPSALPRPDERTGIDSVFSERMAEGEHGEASHGDFGPDETLEASEPEPPESSPEAYVTFDQIVVTGRPSGKFDQSPSFKTEFTMKEPQTVHTISELDLDTVKFSDPYQVLGRVPGITSLRNFRFPVGGRSYTVNLMDGISVRDPLRGQVSDIANFDTDEIQRIEITKGPASAIFASNAFGGVINVITKEPPDEPVRRIWFEGGANGTNDRFRGGGHAAGKIEALDDLGYRFGFNVWDVPSWRENTWTSREVGSGKLTWHPDEASKLTFRGEYLHRVESLGNTLTEREFKQNPQQATGYSSFGDLETLTFYLDYETQVGEDGFLKVSYGARNQYGFNFASFSGPADDDYLDMDGKVTYRHHFDFFDTWITGGLETVYGRDETVSYSFNAVDPLSRGDTVIQHFKIDRFMASPFLQLEVSPVSWMHLTAGVRYDDIAYDARNVLGSTDTAKSFKRFSPKSGITFDLSEEHKLWFNYSFGFSPPGPASLFTNDRPNPNLRPELAENLEVGLRGSLVNGLFDYEVAYYNTDVTDYVVSEIVGRQGGRDILNSVNAGQVNLQGLETSLRFMPVEQLRFEVAHTYALNKYVEFIDAGNDFSGHYVPVSPEHVVNARVAVMPVEKLNIELEIQGQTEYHTHSNNALDPGGTYQRPTMLNLRTSYEFGPAEFWLHFINLTDARAARVSSSQRGANVTRSYTQVEEPLSAYAGIAFRF